jgi:gas vesicle protein
MFYEDDNTGPAILVSFLVGSIVGAGLALLFAPQAGKKTRRQIAELADDVKDYTADYTRKLKDKIA